MARPSGPADFYRARHTSFTYHHVPHLHAFSSHQCPCVSAVPPPQLLYDHCGFVGGVGGGLKSNFICGNSGGGAGGGWVITVCLVRTTKCQVKMLNVPSVYSLRDQRGYSIWSEGAA